MFNHTYRYNFLTIIAIVVALPLGRTTRAWCRAWRRWRTRWGARWGAWWWRRWSTSHVSLNPTQSSSIPCIDTWEVWQGTSRSPTNNSSNDSLAIFVTNKWTAWISLTSILSSYSWKASTHHRWCDASSIGLVTLGISDGRNLDVPQIIGRWAT